MKKVILLFSILFNINCFSQTNIGDNILGKYISENNEGMVEITKRGNKYYGTLVWNKIEGKLDVNNPEKAEHTKPIKEKELLKEFVFNGTSAWHNGTIYAHKNGKNYSCKVTRDEIGHLNVRDFIGISVIGRTTYWLKVK